MSQDRQPARFQHLELTFPLGGLTAEMCADIDRFWCGVFGWKADDVVYEKFGNLHQHRLHADGQTVVLVEADNPMAMPTESIGYGPGQTFSFPHLGIQLASLAELERVLTACQKFQESDDRVSLFDAGENRFPGIQGIHHGFILMYLLPMWFDIFAVDLDPGHERTSGWRYVDGGPSDRALT